MESLELLSLLVIAAYAGWKLHEHFTMLVIKENPEIFEEACRLARAVRDEPDFDGELIEMEIEVHNGVTYAFRKDTGQFLAQAKDVTSAAVAASIRFPGMAFTHPDIQMPDQEDQKS
jgi:hypothetical protein